MAVNFDGENKIISVNLGVTTLDVKTDLYSDWKEWTLLSDNSKYLPAFRTVGGDPLVGSESLGATYFIQNGWKIRPQEADHILSINGNLYQEGGGDYIISTLGNFNVTVLRTVSQLTNAINTGDGGFTAQYQTLLTNLSKTLLNRSRINPNTNELEIYESDGSTIAFKFDLTDQSGNPSSLNVFERVPQ